MYPNRITVIAALEVVYILISVPAVSQSKTQPVVVVNGSSQPVPTAAQGTTNVAGTVTLGSGSTVNIGNAPNVNVTNTPAVSLAPGSGVNVSDPLDAQNNPIPLAILDATQPYEDSCTIRFSGQSVGQCNLATIAGKRLVIQEFDAYGQLETALKPLFIFVTKNGFNSHFFAATFMGTSGGLDFFATHQETRLYAGVNETPNCNVTLSGASNQLYICNLSGFLVDAP